MSGRRVAMSDWEVAEIVWERRSGMTWEQIARLHGVSCHKAKREHDRFCELGRRYLRCA